MSRFGSIEIEYAWHADISFQIARPYYSSDLPNAFSPSLTFEKEFLSFHNLKFLTAELESDLYRGESYTNMRSLTPTKKAYMIDIDGVICEHVPNEFPEKMKTAKEISGARDWINSKYEEGNYICFFTARLDEHKNITKRWLKDHKFKYHRIIFGKPRGGNYHYIDRAHVQATTFKGRFSPMVSVTHGIEVFDDSK